MFVTHSILHQKNKLTNFCIFHPYILIIFINFLTANHLILYHRLNNNLFYD